MDFDRALDLMGGIEDERVDLGGGTPSYPDFEIAEYQRRYRRLQAVMDDAGLEAVVFTQEEPIRYLTGYNSVIWAVGRWLPGAFIATREPTDAVLIPSAFDVGAAGGTSWVTEIDGHEAPERIPDKIAQHLDRLGIDPARVASERATGSIVMLPWSAASRLMEYLPPTDPDASELISAIRMLKSPAEVERIRTIVSATVAGYRAGLEAAHSGMTEKDVVAVVASAIYGNGGTAGTRPLFLNAVAGPDRYPLVDSPASNRVLQSGDVMFLDGGAGGDGYMSDIIRLIGIGDLSPEQERYAEIAGEATRAMVAAAVPGRRASEVFQAGQDVFVDAGLGDRGGGLSGHGIGLEIWERPFLRLHEDEREDIALRPGMTLCLEPILLPLTGGGDLAGIFVFEQQVLITDRGNEVLSGDLPADLWRAP